MKRLALIIAIAFLGTFLNPLASNAENSFVLSEAGDNALKDVARCVESKDQLNVLYLIDASKSLKNSDPDAQRAQILSQSIAGLVAIAQFKEVRFALSTFGDRFTSPRQWREINEQNAQDEQGWVEKNIPTLNNEGGTDWLKALQNAKSKLDESPNGKNSCKLIIWVTDGGIDLDSQVRDTQALQTICGLNPKTGIGDPKNSVVDQIRASGIYLFGVLLNNANAIAAGDQATQKSKMSYMQAIAESSGTVDASWFGGSKSQFFNCGTSPIPANYAPGAFFEAKEPIEILRAMMRISTSLKGCASWGTSADRTFTVDKSVAGVEVSLTSKRWQVISPTNEIVTDEAKGSVSSDGIQVDSVGFLSNINIEKPALTPGVWRIDNNPNSPIEPYYCHGLRVNLNSISLVAGQEAQISGKISRKDGSKFDLANYGSHELSVTALDPQSKTGTPLRMKVTSNGSFGGKFTPKLDAEMVAFDITLVVTNSTGKRFLPLVHRFEMKIRDVTNYPHFEPAEVTLPDLKGRDSSTSGELVIVSASEAGQVCFKKPVVDQVPEGVVSSDYSIAGKATGCIDIPANSPPIKVPFEIKNTKAIDGDIEVLVPATLTIASDSEGISQTMTVKTKAVRGSSAPLWLVLLLLLVSLAVPFGILTLLNARAARLNTRGLRYASIDVEIKPSGNRILVSRVSPSNSGSAGSFGGSLFEIHDWDFVPFAVNKSKNWTSTSGIKLVAKKPSNPFGVVEGFALPASGCRVITGTDQSEQIVFSSIPLNPDNHWILQIPAGIAQGLPSVNGQLMAFLGTASDLVNDGMRMSSEVSANPGIQRLLAQFTGNVAAPPSPSTSNLSAPPASPTPPTALPPITQIDDDPFKGL